MKFCSACGSGIESRIPEGDNRPRHVCISCDTVHYQNPKIVAGCLPEWQGKLLLCRRAIEPRHGFWTPPAGFMENAESLEAAASRETVEEANANVSQLALNGIYSIPHISQVHVFFRAQLVDTNFYAGDESLEVALFDEQDIPWDHLAFRVTTLALKNYYRDPSRMHVGSIIV